MDDNYSNREIDRMFLEIQQTLGRIEGQTTKTNGHVADAFREINKLKIWRASNSVAIAIIVVVVIPLCVYIFNRAISRIDNLSSRINSTVIVK